MALTQKQENFCLAFIETGNASEAYRRAYNTSKMKTESINVKASEVMSNVNVSVRVKELQKEAQERSGITVDRVIAELAKIAFMRESDFYNPDGSAKNLSELSEDQKACLAKYYVKSMKTGEKDKNGKTETIDIPVFFAHDKIKALDMLMKHLGGYTEKIEQTINGSISLNKTKWTLED